MKKTLLTIVMALVLGLGATAQNDDNEWTHYWENSSDNSYSSDLEMFDWSGFVGLFSKASELDFSWNSDFRLSDFGIGDRSGGFDLILPDHGFGGDVDAVPMGSGIMVLLGLSGAYFVAKKRKEDE